MDNSHPYLILGLGITGLSVYKLLKKHGLNVLCFDDNPSDASLTIPTNAFLSLNQASSLISSHCAGIIPSPGISPKHSLLETANNFNVPLFSDIEIGLKFCNAQKIIGVTGTNGKTTVGGMIRHLAKHSGMTSAFAGNNGIPTTTLASQSFDILVLELSSYQLDLCNDKFLDCGVITSLSPDHLDRYETFEHYCQSKASIQNYLRNKNPLILSSQIDPLLLNLQKPQFFNPSIFNTDPNLKISCIDKLNWSLAISALQACFPSIKLNTSSIDSFIKEKHRLEYVTSSNNIHFINDSKATNPEAVYWALKEFPKPVHLLLGGILKCDELKQLKQLVDQRGDYLYFFGQDRTKMQSILNPSNLGELHISLESATRSAFLKALPNETILLSPACSSFDQFKNFKERGNNFIKIVESLKNGFVSR